ncbi:MAG: hypothetical protein IKC11_02955 [Clostridia bacterium]|nr:hypothetical protein [Clostridia bacterium]
MYEKLMNKAKECFNKALQTTDVCLKAFYFGASKGYEDKAKNLTIEEAC